MMLLNAEEFLFHIGGDPLQSFCQMLGDSKVTFTGAFSWTPTGAEMGRGTLNNEAFYFYLCDFSVFKILIPSASPQSSEVLFVRKRNDFCAGVTQSS